MGSNNKVAAGSQIVSLTLPRELVDRIEEAAKANYCSRSDYIRTALVLRLNKQEVVPIPPDNTQSEEEFLAELTERYQRMEQTGEE